MDMSPAEPADFRRFDSRPSRELIADPARVHRMLQNLWERRVLLSAKLEGDENWYTTALLDVNPMAGTIVLDELAPDKGHERVEVGTRLRVTGVLGGVPVRFAGEVADIAVENDIAYYRVAMPQQLEYLQRRAFFRAYVPRSMELRVQMVMEERFEVTGRLLDVSLGGFGMQFAQECPLAPLDIVTVRALQLPEGQTIGCTAEVRYTQPVYGQKLIRAGARFFGLDKPVERTLLRAIYCLEREQIRKRPPAD
jgi:flagellar brake protein